MCGLETMQKLCIHVNSFVEIVVTNTAVIVIPITITVNRKNEQNFTVKHVLCVDMACAVIYR